jgi:hypothetical protein
MWPNACRAGRVYRRRRTTPRSARRDGNAPSPTTGCSRPQGAADASVADTLVGAPDPGRGETTNDVHVGHRHEQGAAGRQHAMGLDEDAIGPGGVVLDAEGDTGTERAGTERQLSQVHGRQRRVLAARLPPTFDATHGTLQLIASSSALAWPSVNEGRTKTSAAA